VPKRSFAEQMYVLREAGYRAVTMQQVLDAWTTGAELPAQPLVVSFDDGNRTQVEGAGPMLKALGWPGVLNLELNNLGSKGIKVSAIRALIDAGWEIGSHTVSHPDLTKVSDARLRAELEDSRAQIAERFGLDATIFCYPAGKCCATAWTPVSRRRRSCPSSRARRRVSARPEACAGTATPAARS
jgi:peptidoglycan/xylan/chitin deacetylase (PgdA/CDA1 family)